MAKWQQRQIIDIETEKRLKRQLLEVRQYLKTTFKLNFNLHTPVTSHCLTHALNDPTNQQLQNQCPEGHKYLCDSCKKFDQTFAEIQQILEENLPINTDIGQNQRNFDLEVESVEIEQSIDDIFEFRRHIVRSVHSEFVRKTAINELEENEAWVTVDWAQKLLATSFREKQSEYFGKRGLSWHIAHVIAKVSGKLVSHTFIHILEKGAQVSKIELN